MEILCLCVCVWLFSSEGAWLHEGNLQFAYLAFANILRLWVGTLMIREVLLSHGESLNIDSQNHSSGSVSPSVLQHWVLASVVFIVWYFVATIQAKDSRIAYMMGVLAGINIVMGGTSPCLLKMRSEPEGSRIRARTFRVPSGANTASPLQPEACCVICLTDLEEGQMVCQLPCSHAFHEPCIRKWLAVSACCPMRCALPDADAESGAVDEAIAASEGGSGEAEGARAAGLAGAGRGSLAAPEASLEVPRRTDGEVAVAAAAARRRMWAMRWRQRVTWHGAVRRVSELAAEGQNPAPGVVEDWAEAPVAADWSGGACGVVLSEPALPPESEPG
eukprot:CAMPEP_0179082692 /NCGR_PEP_ID=MMETSP0796-20121207/37298_1 /TAXON_ID=73915 /ORGANISM="Pyrodinium bahamense, Strain pbaha01" /LENGTH=332 /DNA_ID=CAMNT_0020780085 /DNA_START=77 /DNA_END=1075 /DNA_ORIENTATION=+